MRKLSLSSILILVLLSSLPLKSYAAEVTSNPVISVVNSGTTSFKISWKKVRGYDTYLVYRSTEYSGKYTNIAEVKSLSYIDTNLSAGNAYFYKIKAKKSVNKKITKFSNVEYGFVSLKSIPDPASEDLIYSDKKSVIIVSTKNTTTAYANFSLYILRDGKYKLEFSTLSHVGKKGIGKTKEGDGKTPTGKFTFSMAFGIKSAPSNLKIPYTQIDSSHWVVSDSSSKYYNQFVSTKNVKKDWKDSYGEQLYRYTTPYEYSLFLDYNKEGTKGKGSAIFLHAFSGKEYTAGCIAIPVVKLKSLLQKIEMDDNTISSEIVINTKKEIDKIYSKEAG